MKRTFILISVLSLTMPGLRAEERTYGDVKPRLYLTERDVERARAQASAPELRTTYEKMESDAARSLRNWYKRLPRGERRSMQDLFDHARADTRQPDYLSDAAAYAIRPTDELAEMIREKLLVEAGIADVHGSWRQLGIHEGERLCRFLRAYDLMAATGVFAPEEKQAVRSCVERSARFLEAWTMENDLTGVYQGQSYCFNIKFYPYLMLATVAMYYPEMEDAPRWLALAQEKIPGLLFTENFIDGAYGEGSVHYLHPTMDGMLYYLAASRNLGYKDYFKENPSFMAQLRRMLWWRMQLIAPDGRKAAVGDAHRAPVGADLLERAGSLFGEPRFTWASRYILSQTTGGRLLSAYDLLEYDCTAPAEAPDNLSANFVWSGYALFRSGWKPDGNFLMFKYGPTYCGRRETDRQLVLSGHAHADALSMELHWDGVPMLVDPGYRGRYENSATYGGFWRATVSHNTVGLGNPWGYDRQDGRMEEHCRRHGGEFRYEREQRSIGRQDYSLDAFGDVGGMGVVSAEANTYGHVRHRRSIVWWRDNSLTVVSDRLRSDRVQPYELYFWPVGDPVARSGECFSFGDSTARLDILPVGTDSRSVRLIRRGDPSAPPYYMALDGDLKTDRGWDGGADARWGFTTLMVQSRRAAGADYLNVLIPSRNGNPYKIEKEGSSGRLLVRGDERIAVVPSRSRGGSVTHSGDFAVVRTLGGRPADFVLGEGTRLAWQGHTLVAARQTERQWEPLYDPRFHAAVCLEARRASLTFHASPLEQRMMVAPPMKVKGQEPFLPLLMEVTLWVGRRPHRMVALDSDSRVPQLDDPRWDAALVRSGLARTDPFHADIEARLRRRPVDFTWDEVSGCVTFTLPVNSRGASGFYQIVWE